MTPGRDTRILEATRSTRAAGGLGLAIQQHATWSLETANDGAQASQATAPTEFYTRWGNPTVRRLEDAIAELEDGETALATASGMGAIATALIDQARNNGQRIVAQSSLYSATQELMTRLLADYGVQTVQVPTGDTSAYEDAITPETSLVYLETPSNPLLEIADIEAICEAAHAENVPVFVDNTFASPVNQQPLTLGADLVLHSATKALGGHSDVTGGLLVGSEERLERAWTTYKMLGPTLAPNDAFLIHRGVKTLGLRVERQNENALALARYLADHPRVARVHYPGLATHPNHDVAKDQMSGFGGILSFEIDGSVETGRQVLESTQVALLGVSLGGVETLIQHPASMTHAPLSAKERRKAGIADGLIRVSCGIEDTDDLIEDLDQALASA